MVLMAIIVLASVTIIAILVAMSSAKGWSRHRTARGRPR